MLSWYVYCLKKYFSFQGRAGRTEYWNFTIINIVVLLLFQLALQHINPDCVPAIYTPSDSHPTLYKIVFCVQALFALLVLLPQLSVTARRLHDRNHSALWILAIGIPYLDLIPFVMLLLESERSPNPYGRETITSPFYVADANQQQKSTNSVAYELNSNQKPTNTTVPQRAKNQVGLIDDLIRMSETNSSDSSSKEQEKKNA